jgi:L-serine/L-threonine ammonia-lyase
MSSSSLSLCDDHRMSDRSGKYATIPMHFSSPAEDRETSHDPDPMPLHIVTPLVASRPLSAAAGRSIDLKLEALQPSGSFKLRGIGHACETYATRGARRFLSSSGGNAGIAVAEAGRALGIPVTVVVPETTTAHAMRQIRDRDATLIVHGASWQEAHAHVLALRGDGDALLHPFDDPLLWDGHATMIDEVARTGRKPDAVVVSVGGGGLLAGVAAGLDRNGWSDVAIVAVETTGTASLHRAIAANERITLDSISGVATSLGAKQVCERAFELARAGRVASTLVDDLTAVDACIRFMDDHRLVVEPACGAALALAYGASPTLESFGRVLVVVCGGSTATLAQLSQWNATLHPDHA